MSHQAIEEKPVATPSSNYLCFIGMWPKTNERSKETNADSGCLVDDVSFLPPVCLAQIKKRM